MTTSNTVGVGRIDTRLQVQILGGPDEAKLIGCAAYGISVKFCVRGLEAWFPEFEFKDSIQARNIGIRRAHREHEVWVIDIPIWWAHPSNGSKLRVMLHGIFNTQNRRGHIEWIEPTTAATAVNQDMTPDIREIKLQSPAHRGQDDRPDHHR